ncbi:MAG TPA: ABC transporter substrate-binding protein [Solirubrobacterales bacterium]|jgi:peptide/nickel transport system substrate-binding protein|nr:ABC transporter substrate-binding protein [Solirubrobacterales bacterium]
MVRGILAVLVLAAVAILGLVGCGDSGGGKEGGTLLGTYSSFPELDPGLAITQEAWIAMYNTYLPLLTYAHANGSAGSQVVPALAKGLPKISNGGKTYTLFLRPGLKYSNGEPVKPSDFRFAIERTIRLNSLGSPFYTNIVGAEEFQETKQGGIPGIKANDRTGEIVVDLVRPQGTFLNVLAMPFAAPLPESTPIEDLSSHPPAASGPYLIASVRSERSWEFERNPQWAKTNSKAMPDLPSGHVDKIKIDVVRNQATQVSDVEQGKYDWMENPPPPDQYNRIRQQFEGTQFRVEHTISTYYFWMNTTKPPFDDPKVRQAVNYAVNREALERIYAGQLIGSSQILPPGMPGYRKFDHYHYNLAKAKRMIAEANPSDTSVTVWTDNEPENQEAGEYYDGVLKEIGLKPTLKAINADNYFTVIGNQSTPDLDTGWSDWFQDYPHPSDFFQPLIGENIAPTSNLNIALMNDPELNQEVRRLGEQQLGPKQESEYAELDERYMEQAPWAPYGNRTVSTFISSAINLDNVVFNLTFGQDLTSFEFK